MKHTFLRTGAAAAALFVTSFGTAQATTIDIVRLSSDARESVHGIRDDTNTLGTDLNGTQITATYADGSSEVIVWHSNAQTITEEGGYTYTTIDGHANGANIDVMLTWDGFEVSTSSLLTSLSIDLLPTGAVFDTTYTFDSDADGNPNPLSTQGSSFGFPFELYSQYADLEGSITATYSGIVNLLGAPAVGDLFTTMLVDFSNLATSGVLGNIAFRSDLDVMRYRDDLSPVPLPTSLSFLLLGLGGLGLSRRVSKRRS